MIRGIVALFASGLLTNPLVLLGVITGSLFYAFLSANEIYLIYKTPAFYGISLLLVCSYILGFRRVYQENGKTDWKETFLAIIGGLFKFVVASVLMISFISLFDFGDAMITANTKNEF